MVMLPVQNQRQERRAAARRSEILRAAGELFAEKGYHRATTRDIAVAADVSEGTIYNYFVSKEDLLFAIMAQIADNTRLDEELDQSLPNDPYEFFIAMLDARHAFLDENRVMLQAVLSEILVNPELRQRYYRESVLPMQQQLQNHLEERVRSGQIRLAEPALAARILMALFSGLFLLEVVGDEAIDERWDDLVRQLADLLFSGASRK